MFMMVAAESLVKWVANRIRWVAVWVIDYLVKRMFLWVTLLSFGWMVMERGEKGWLGDSSLGSLGIALIGCQIG